MGAGGVCLSHRSIALACLLDHFSVVLSQRASLGRPGSVRTRSIGMTETQHKEMQTFRRELLAIKLRAE
jgi:hypothetical protein